MQRILVTGAAGFIGANVTRELLSRGHQVTGIDNLNDYYDPSLKRHRLDGLQSHKGFDFVNGDLADPATVAGLFAQGAFPLVIHLAAQAGVRYSIDNPDAYLRANLMGFHYLLEQLRTHTPEHFVYASSSSVYGNSSAESFAETDRTDTPVSLYAATKKANEAVAHSYAELYRIPSTGLRFFTVYGPAGRPDMAYFNFTRAILAGEPIRVFNHGDLQRDFTYIDDIVSGILKIADAPPTALATPYRILNLGNNTPVKLGDFIATLERLLGVEAVKEHVGMQPGDVYRTYANIDAARALVGYHPKTDIETGLSHFVNWYREYFNS